MASPIELNVVTAEKRLLSETVDEVRAPSAEGYFGVRSGHAPFLAEMAPGELSFKSAGQQRSYAVSEGFVEVSGDKVTVLAESAVAADQIDLERARQTLAEAEAKMKGLNTNEPAYKHELARAKWAQAQIDVGSRR